MTTNTDHENAELLFNQGTELCEQGNYIEAEAKLKEALEIMPNHEDVMYNLALIYFEQKRYNSAWELVNKINDIDCKYLINELKKTGFENKITENQTKKNVCPQCGFILNEPDWRCPECFFEFEDESSLQHQFEFNEFTMKQSFNCFIPDEPVTRWEQIEVGLTTMGAFRGVWREATANFDEKNLEIFAEDNEGKRIEVNNIPIHEISRIGFEKISLKNQIKAAFIKSLVAGLGMGFVIIVLLISRIGTEQSAIVFAIGFGLLGGEILGLLFSFIPSLIKLKRNLWHLQLFNKDGVAPLIAVDTKEKREVQKILSNA